MCHIGGCQIGVKTIDLTPIFLTMEIKIAIGNRIKELRNRKGLSQEEFADLAHIDRTYVTRLETGKRNVTISSLEKIIKALDTSYSDFFNHKSFSDDGE